MTDGSAPDGAAAGAAAAMTRWRPGSYLELWPFPRAVPCARRHAKLALCEWGMQAFAEAVELVVSELVTNALRASAGLSSLHQRRRAAGPVTAGVPPVRLWLASDQRKVLVEVWDASDDLPVLPHAGPEAEGGRGLLLVEAVSADWGSYIPGGCGGKVAWAVVTAV